MKRLLLLASGLLALAALPATSAAATHASGIIYTDSVQVRAYKMQLLALTKSTHHGAFLSIAFTRGTSTDKQDHYYQFSTHVRVDLAPGGASGTIKADLGTYGRVDLKFSAGAGGRTTPGCRGALLFEHAGTLTGTFHFVSGSTYFKTIDRGSLRAATATGKKGLNCKPPTLNKTHGTGLDVASYVIPGLGSAGTQPLGTENDFNIERDLKGHIIEQFFVLDASHAKEGVVISDAIDRAKLPASAFTNASDLSSANAVASGQFMSGSVAFTSIQRFGNTATGMITGSITANFDGMAPITLQQDANTHSSLTVS